MRSHPRALQHGAALYPHPVLHNHISPNANIGPDGAVLPDLCCRVLWVVKMIFYTRPQPQQHFWTDPKMTSRGFNSHKPLNRRVSIERLQHRWANCAPGATCGPMNSLIRPAEPHNDSSKSQMKRVVSLIGQKKVQTTPLSANTLACPPNMSSLSISSWSNLLSQDF